MSSTPFDVVVFDFDGTLVRSAEAKWQAFFEVFPPTCAPAVEAVLERDPDGSRHRVIPEMIAEAARRGFEVAGLEPARLVEAYGLRVREAVERAAAMPGAAEALGRAGEVAAVYVASATPHADLLDLLARRGWLRLIDGAFGHPHEKHEVVAMLLARHSIAPARLLVVGDGVSDREAAERNGCPFHAVTGMCSLMRIPGLTEERHDV